MTAVAVVVAVLRLGDLQKVPSKAVSLQASKGAMARGKRTCAWCTDAPGARSALEDLDVVGNGALTAVAVVIAVPRLGDLEQVSIRACQRHVHDFMLHLIPAVHSHGGHNLLCRSRGW